MRRRVEIRGWWGAWEEERRRVEIRNDVGGWFQFFWCVPTCTNLSRKQFPPRPIVFILAHLHKAQGTHHLYLQLISFLTPQFFQSQTASRKYNTRFRPIKLPNPKRCVSCAAFIDAIG